MAPITATLTGIQPQVIDDQELLDFLARLRAFDVSSSVKDDHVESTATAPVDVDGLVAELERYPKWRFQELVSYLLNWSIPFDFIFLHLIMDFHSLVQR